MHHVYILVSQNSPDKIYIGITTDLDHRIAEHNGGESSYSKRYAPWRLETYVSFSNKKLAFVFEKYLKAGSGYAFLKKRFLPK